MKYDICPECGITLAKNLTACACGWQHQPSLAASKNYSCAYHINGENCTEHGTLCLRPYSNGPWYCKQHFYAKN